MRDAVYLAVPAYPLPDAAARDAALAAARAFADALGRPLVASPLLDEFRRPGAWLHAEARRADLARGMEHGVLLAARGGYGCLDLVEPLMRGDRRVAPLLVGFSDATVLHAIWRRRGWGETIYGFMPAAPHGTRALVSAAAAARGLGLACDAHDAPAARVLATGVAEGVVFAACLRVLAGLVGTPAMPDLRGTILGLEDIDERPYRVDRDLTQLHLAGALAGVRGLAFGAFPCTLPDGYAGPTIAEVAGAWARRLAVPTLLGLPIGHDPDPLALPNGRPARLTCEPDRWSLDVEPRAVAS